VTGDPLEISLRNLCVLCATAVNENETHVTAEAQRLRRVKIRDYQRATSEPRGLTIFWALRYPSRSRFIRLKQR
jgi:hypothetical protein